MAWGCQATKSRGKSRNAGRHLAPDTRTIKRVQISSFQNTCERGAGAHRNKITRRASPVTHTAAAGVTICCFRLEITASPKYQQYRRKKIVKMEEKKKKGSWDPQSLQTAIDKVMSKELSVRQAAMRYNIPKSTIH
ncbi:uncharacterized protein LOC132902098 [Amyelois transitella]|uniref:uncharacterized protein LOC132902098 n=1 Tax=Amyelois transitella TaxID=680683 RepID=UPI00298F6D8F|nr:uncharacterized protein LOC132902098 [Amyelois transitella]